MESYNTRDPLYIKLKEKLKKQKSGNRILHVYTPGTGCTAETDLSIKRALDLVSENASANFARIDLDGVGITVEGTDKIAPAQRSSNHLTPTKKTRRQEVKNLIKSPLTSILKSEFNLDPLLNLSELGAEWNGIATGSGEIENNQLILNTLQALANNKESDNVLPDTLVLIGHSRGAVSSIKLANDIYVKYGDKIKVDLVLTDPVAGPGHWHEWDKMVIPPNVRSATIFYAKDEDNLLLSPLDLRKLVLSNPATTLTTCALGVTHIGIANNLYVSRQAANIIASLNGINIKEGKQEFLDTVKNYKKSLADNKAKRIGLKQKIDEHIQNHPKVLKEQIDKLILEKERLLNKQRDELIRKHEKQIKEQPDKLISEKGRMLKKQIDELIRNHKKELKEQIAELKQEQTNELNYLNKSLTNCEILIKRLEHRCNKPDPNQQKSAKINSVRSNCVYAGTTNKHPELTDKAWQAHNELRQDSISGYSVQHPKNSEYSGNTYSVAETASERKQQLQNDYKNAKPYNVSYGELAAYLLILPTLGFSANFYFARQKLEMSHRLLSFASGIGTFNLAPAAQLIVQTTAKLLHNSWHGGLLQPPVKFEQLSNMASTKLGAPTDVPVEAQGKPIKESDPPKNTVPSGNNSC